MKIGTLDCETDPFATGTVILPFCVGVYTGDDYRAFWGDDCVEQTIGYLESLPEPYTFYAHNGGNFDWYFFLKYLDGDLRLINDRIALGWLGQHQIRDSYSIFPDPLSAYKKDDLTDLDYKTKFIRPAREDHKDFILKYLRNDCVYLYEAVTEFLKRFGEHLTIGGCAMKQLRKFHQFEVADEKFHNFFKPFYFGGRNQCFESGVIHGDFSSHDVNSQYPSVMRNFQHPIGTGISESDRIGPNTFFAEIVARNYGCLPIRTDHGLDFTSERGTYFATIHEIKAGLDTGTLVIDRVNVAYNFHKVGNFGEFVDHYYDLRLKAKKEGDKLGNLFYKRLPNSSYGKFAQSPENYEDNIITHDMGAPNGFSLKKCNGEYYIWGKPSERKTYYNIATGASITGAARAILLRGLSSATRPLYCDTDNIICERFRGDIDPNRLGAWKHEGDLDMIAIAGKKLYAGFKDGECVKKAHKGARLSAEDIIEIAEGAVKLYENPAPSFNLGRPINVDMKKQYTKRRIRKTALV